MNDDKKPHSELAHSNEETVHVATIGEFLSGLVELGKERQGINHEVHTQPDANRESAH